MSAEKILIARRTLTLLNEGKEEELLISLYQPEADPLPGGDWQCLVEIGADNELVFGVDSFQALLMGVQYISMKLDEMKKSGCELKWLGMDNLGFGPLLGLNPEF
jgi:hypothetical protein